MISTVQSAWSDDLPFVAPDGAIAIRDAQRRGLRRRRLRKGAPALEWRSLRLLVSVRLDRLPPSHSRGRVNGRGETRQRTAAVRVPAPAETDQGETAAPTPAPDSGKLGFTVSFATLLDESQAREQAAKIAVERPGGSRRHRHRERNDGLPDRPRSVSDARRGRAGRTSVGAELRDLRGYAVTGHRDSAALRLGRRGSAPRRIVRRLPRNRGIGERSRDYRPRCDRDWPCAGQAPADGGRRSLRRVAADSGPGAQRRSARVGRQLPLRRVAQPHRPRRSRTPASCS